MSKLLLRKGDKIATATANGKELLTFDPPIVIEETGWYLVDFKEGTIHKAVLDAKD